MKKNLLKSMLAAVALLSSVNAGAVTETYDFLSLLNGGYTQINSSGTKTFEGKTLNVISSFSNTSGVVGANVGGRIAALYQGGNGNNFWFRDAIRPWFVSASKTSFMAFDNLKKGDEVRIVGGVSPITILCDNVLDADWNSIANGTEYEATYTEDAPLVLVAAEDGYIYASYGDYTAIKKIIIETSAAEMANDPIITISGANGIERTVTINANTGSVGSEQVAYYTLDGSDPTNASTKYTEPIKVSETTTIKAISYCGEAASNVVSLEVEAGSVIALNAPVLSVVNMKLVNDVYVPVYTVSIDNSSLIGAPTATLKAIFGEEDVTSALRAGTFSPSATGALVVTATAEGYDESTTTIQVFSEYEQAYATKEYSELADEAAVLAVLGDGWAAGATTRWANWNKTNSVYSDQYLVFSTTATEGNVYVDVDEKLRSTYQIQFVMGFGFGRNMNSGTVNMFINDTGSANDITLYRVISSKGANENTYRETYVVSNEEGYSAYGIPAGETLCKAVVFTPTQVALAINEIGTKAARQQSDAIYNLAGQRVMNAQKGLYIINGKKVIK